MRTSGSGEVMRAINSDSSGLPGTMVRRPDFPVPSASSRNRNETPFFCHTPPWQGMQFWFRIGRISRLKRTSSPDSQRMRADQAAIIATVSTKIRRAILAAEDGVLPGMEMSFIIELRTKDIADESIDYMRRCDLVRLRPR